MSRAVGKGPGDEPPAAAFPREGEHRRGPVPSPSLGLVLGILNEAYAEPRAVSTEMGSGGVGFSTPTGPTTTMRARTYRWRGTRRFRGR